MVDKRWVSFDLCLEKPMVVVPLVEDHAIGLILRGCEQHLLTLFRHLSPRAVRQHVASVVGAELLETAHLS
jgi:hypothetical protein